MKKSTILLSGFFFLSICQANDFEGIWIAEKRTKGGLGSQINIYSASGIDITFGALWNFNYRFDHDTLVILDSKNVPSKYNMYTLCRDTLYPVDQHLPSYLKLKGYLESTKPESKMDSIVGTWTFKHDEKTPAYYRFSKNLKGYLFVQMNRQKATYRLLDKSKIEMKYESGNMEVYTLDSSGSTLIAENKQEFKKFEF